MTTKQKALIGGASFVAIGLVVGTGYLLLNDEDSNDKVKINDTNQVVNIIDDEGEEEVTTPISVNDREVLPEDVLKNTLNEVKELAYNGSWNEIISAVDSYDKEYNINSTDDGKLLKSIFFDANVLQRLRNLGDNSEAVEEAVSLLPRLSNEEMYVLGLYYLPRNVILELSSSTLALAPTNRGYVEIIERTDLPMVDEEGYYNEEIDNHSIIQNFVNSPVAPEFIDGFVRLDVLNGGIEEYVYLAYMNDASIILIGFHSDDDSPENTTKTVAHYLQFRERITEGVDKWYDESGEDLQTEDNGSHEDEDTEDEGNDEE